MKFEDWTKLQNEATQEMCKAIIEHNNSLVNGHNGLMYIDLNAFEARGKLLNGTRHFGVYEFEEYCEENKTSSDYPLGGNRWIHHYNQ